MLDKDKQTCPKEGESNPRKENTEVVAKMENEVQQEIQTNQINHLSRIHYVDYVH